MNWKIPRASTALGTLAIVIVSGAAIAASTYDAMVERAVPGTTLNYENINPAIQMATAYGDKGAGEHGTFGRFPGNFITPFHTHSGAYHGVVIKGVMTNPFKDEANPPQLPPGSYWYVPANSVHATACVSATPCEFYFHAESAFDFHPAE